MKHISPAKLKEKMDRGQEYEIIDVREPHEHEICRIEGSKLLPMSQLMTSAHEIKGEHPVVMYCHHGNRSQAAVNFMEKQRPDVEFHNLQGGIHQWAEEVDEDMPTY